MSAALPGHHPTRERLLEQLFTARDLAAALQLVFNGFFRPEGAVWAVFLLDERGVLRGERGMGWDQRRVRRIVERAGDASGLAPLRKVMEQGSPVEVPAPAGNPRGAPSRYTALTASCAARGDPPLGLFLLAGPHGPLLLTPGFLEQFSSIRVILSRVHRLTCLEEENARYARRDSLLTAIFDALPDPVLITNAKNRMILGTPRAERLFPSRGAVSSDNPAELNGTLPLSGRIQQDRCEEADDGVAGNQLRLSSWLTRRSGAAEPPYGDLRRIIQPGRHLAFSAKRSLFPDQELRLTDPPGSGEDRVFEVMTSPLAPGICGEGTRISVLHDVTDRWRIGEELERQFRLARLAEMKSRRERERLDLILENVRDPILVTDRQANIILLNREAERLFVPPDGADISLPQRQNVRTNGGRFSSFISGFARSPESTMSGRVKLRERETGMEFSAEIVSGKVLNEKGGISAIVSVVHDRTSAVENERLASELVILNESLEDRIREGTLELEERNRRLEWQRGELERAYRLKSQFLASMSHELRTPINALLGYTSLMRDQIYGELNPRQEEALTRMYTASEHLLDLVNDVLDLARIEAGRMPVNIEPVDVGMVIREVSQTIEPMMRRKCLEYRLELAPQLPIIRTDLTKVKQVVLNLLSNAVKFTHEGGVSVSTETSRNNDGILIEVSDTGIGIMEEDLDKIFEDFRQVDQSSTREYGGTGLGLSISRKLLELLGGTMRVESGVGSGSRFTVWLPSESRPIVLGEEAVVELKTGRRVRV
ncbi:MAG: PAS domain-containing protein [Gemmatimonadota bacterium]|jgi:signal transduction histidine kinase|nr:PAS domain-containing protein [Gemmatimonadota bacterium]